MALGSIFTIIGLLLSPISAQKEKFGDIECESLKVSSGDVLIHIRPYDIAIFDDGPTFRGAVISADEVLLREGDKKVIIGTDRHGGFVSTHVRSKGSVIMGIDDKGHGAISAYDKNGYIHK